MWLKRSYPVIQQDFVGEPSEPEGAVVASLELNGSRIAIRKQRNKSCEINCVLIYGGLLSEYRLLLLRPELLRPAPPPTSCRKVSVIILKLSRTCDTAPAGKGLREHADGEEGVTSLFPKPLSPRHSVNTSTTTGVCAPWKKTAPCCWAAVSDINLSGWDN